MPTQRRNRGGFEEEGLVGGKGALLSGKAMAAEPGQARTLLEAGSVLGWAPLTVKTRAWLPGVVPESGAQA